jgi:hypothetical protein
VKPLIKTFLADGLFAPAPPMAAGLGPTWASVSESDGGTRLSFPSTDPDREVFQPNPVVGICHGRHTPRSSSPWPSSCRPLVFTRATSVFTPAVPPISHQCSAVHGNPQRHRREPRQTTAAERGFAAGLQCQNTVPSFSSQLVRLLSPCLVSLGGLVSSASRKKMRQGFASALP